MLHLKKSNAKNIQSREGESNHISTAIWFAEISCQN